MKIGRWRGRETAASPEYEDVKAASQKHDVPPKIVYAAAIAAYSAGAQTQWNEFLRSEPAAECPPSRTQ
jgi:uncharacterized protein (DUF111 family)